MNKDASVSADGGLICVAAQNQMRFGQQNAAKPQIQIDKPGCFDHFQS